MASLLDLADGRLVFGRLHRRLASTEGDHCQHLLPPYDPKATRTHDIQRPEQDGWVQQHDQDDVDPAFPMGGSGEGEVSPEQRREG